MFDPVHVTIPEPGREVCDFCGAPPVVWEYPCPPFDVPELGWGSPDTRWAACAICADLIECGDRDELQRRAFRAVAEPSDRIAADAAHFAATIQARFWALRSGPRHPHVSHESGVVESFESDDPVLAELMAMAFAAARTVARCEELKVPVLAYRTPDGSYSSAHFGPSPDHPADLARVLLAARRATHAAIAFESWQVDVLATDETRAEVAAGRVPGLGIRPSLHPDRYSTLLVLGEARGRPQLYRSWRIGVDPSRLRTFTRWSEAVEAVPNTRFNPLFVGHDVVRRLVRESAELQRLRDTARAARN